MDKIPPLSRSRRSVSLMDAHGISESVLSMLMRRVTRKERRTANSRDRINESTGPPSSPNIPRGLGRWRPLPAFSGDRRCARRDVLTHSDTLKLDVVATQDKPQMNHLGDSRYDVAEEMNRRGHVVCQTQSQPRHLTFRRSLGSTSIGRSVRTRRECHKYASSAGQNRFSKVKILRRMAEETISYLMTRYEILKRSWPGIGRPQLSPSDIRGVWCLFILDLMRRHSPRTLRSTADECRSPTLLMGFEIHHAGMDVSTLPLGICSAGTASVTQTLVPSLIGMRKRSIRSIGHACSSLEPPEGRAQWFRC